MARANGKVHLVGSLGLDSAEAAFRILASALGGRAPRYPDGEPGARSNWIRWQNGTFARHPAFRPAAARKIAGYGDGAARPLYCLADNVAPDRLEIGPLGYAAAGLDSWAVFRRLAAEGALPPGTRFLVCLPTSAALLTSFVDPAAAPAVEPALERAMRAEVERLCAEIPAGALAIQWDVACETIAIDGGQPPLHYADPLGGSIARVARHIGWVPAGVETGVHLCYGDPGHRHVIEPESLATCVALANGLCAAAARPLHFMHMPVPRERSDDGYAAPLAGLRLNPETELHIGCIHYTDGVAGTRARLDAVRKYASDFGVATECGFGRRDPATIPDLLRIHAAIADSEKAGAGA